MLSKQPSSEPCYCVDKDKCTYRTCIPYRGIKIRRSAQQDQSSEAKFHGVSPEACPHVSVCVCVFSEHSSMLVHIHHFSIRRAYHSLSQGDLLADRAAFSSPSTRLPFCLALLLQRKMASTCGDELFAGIVKPEQASPLNGG